MQFNFFHLLILAVLAVAFITPVHSAPFSEQELEALVGLQEKVTDYLGSSNLSPAQKKEIEDIMAKKEAAIKSSFGK
ncbi:hypothetical protein GCK72_011979 [Caenorhabditis remanei]|uniref:Uncharacterized protein n=1 Tax=Caenorhabditis remanei TaxID=31234 RepID=A0A6A5GMI2_CAERE|nr:hypothetical protein GCK72_011979 [Caenorhabditis remanei]KAF1755529.1 hypothetical protein GCK72_011979 [Caenorhabditis remanei]